MTELDKLVEFEFQLSAKYRTLLSDVEWMLSTGYTTDEVIRRVCEEIKIYEEKLRQKNESKTG